MPVSTQRCCPSPPTSLSTLLLRHTRRFRALAAAPVVLRLDGALQSLTSRYLRVTRVRAEP